MEHKTGLRKTNKVRQLFMVAEKDHPHGRTPRRLPWRARWRPPNVQFTQFMVIQYLMSFLIKLNGKYNTNK